MHILSFGAGVNSVALVIWLVENQKPLDQVVFADTGGEVPETYGYLKIMEKYLQDRGIPLRRVVRPSGGTLYDTCWNRRVIPSAVWRWSTRDFKVGPIHRYYRSLGTHVYQYMAIAYDEVERMKDSRVEYVTNLYPLVDARITRRGCLEIIARAGLPEPVKSGCFFCPFNSIGRWRWLYEEHPDLFDKAVMLEENSKHFPSQRLTDQAFRNQTDISLRRLMEIFRRGEVLPALAANEQHPCGAECMT